ncbi:hypothetical protein [Sagittula sp. SSi028]|uniref:hypothetical protein n=1 Tax=Sagittula sp. SSi028 TaxID=3400636 RepID=UPI003AF95A76
MKQTLLTFAVAAGTAFAEPPRVEQAEAIQAGGGWRVSVTLSHPDTGWDHYADGWRVEDATGQEIGLRVLHHPHEHEQPFTRSLTLDSLPEGPLFVRARCSVDGWSETTHALDVSR